MTRLWALLLATSALATPLELASRGGDDKPGKSNGNGNDGGGRGHGKDHHDDDWHGNNNGTSPYQVLAEPMIGIPSLGLPAVSHHGFLPLNARGGCCNCYSCDVHHAPQ